VIQQVADGKRQTVGNGQRAVDGSKWGTDSKQRAGGRGQCAKNMGGAATNKMRPRHIIIRAIVVDHIEIELIVALAWTQYKTQ
jgi:hypothetical protein